MDVKFVDTTFRDGSQSLWASGMRSGMMEAVAADMDRAGFAVIEVPANAIYFKKIIRDLKEDPWRLMASLAAKIPNTKKGCMGGTLNLLISVAYITLIAGSQMLILMYYARNSHDITQDFYTILAIVLTFNTLISLIAGLIPMRLGLKNLINTEL